MCFKNNHWCKTVSECWKQIFAVFCHWLSQPTLLLFVYRGDKHDFELFEVVTKGQNVSDACLWCSYHSILLQSPLSLCAWYDEVLNALCCFQQKCMCSANTVYRVVFLVPRLCSSYQLNLLRFEWRVSTCFNMCNHDIVMFCVASASTKTVDSFGGPDDCMSYSYTV